MLFRSFISAREVGKRWLLLAGLSLAAAGAARAQTPAAGVRISEPPASDAKSTPILINDSPYKAKGPPPVVYVDGKRFDSRALGTINPNDTESVDILKDAKALQLAPDGGQWGAIIITTKAGRHTRAVRAFNRRLKRLARRQP